jgi:hypothetical protein
MKINDKDKLNSLKTRIELLFNIQAHRNPSVWERKREMFLSKINTEIASRVSVSSNVIYKENFQGHINGWVLNYKGFHAHNTNRIEGSKMVFEAQKEDWNDEPNGAFIEIHEGVFNAFTYEISCSIRASANSSMSFCLWVHDSGGAKWETNPEIAKSTKINSQPGDEFHQPGEQFEAVKLKYIATYTNRLRIHLHCKPGEGRIEVESLTVKKL